MLRFSDVVVNRGALRVLDGTTVGFRRGSRTMVVGENGSGKTTMLKTALGLLAPDQGSVELLGRNPLARRGRSDQYRAAYVHQGAIDVDIPISAAEVVAIGTSGRKIGRNERSRLIEDSMERTGCRSVARRPYRVLSGGEKQKVSIARCLAQQSELLLLDEPCASLDPAASEEIMELLESLPPEVTIVMVSHQSAHFNRPGWRVLELRNGCVS